MATTTDTASMPPAFPAWMRDRDPMLAAEDTNGLFQAFRLRRAGREINLPYLPDPAIMALCSLAGLVAISDWRIVVVMATTVLVSLLAWFVALNRRVRAGERLPLRLTQIFSSAAPRQLGGSLGRDLWLLPLAGSEVAEAIYLEQREGGIRMLVRPVGVDAVWLAVVWLAVIRPAPAEMALELFPLAVLVLVWRKAVRWYLTEIEPSQCREVVNTEVRRWVAVADGMGVEAANLAGRATRSVIVFFAVAVAVAVALAVAMCGVPFVGGVGRSLGPQRPLMAGLVFVIAYLALVALDLWGSDEDAPKWQAVPFTEANPQYRPYLRKITDGID